MSIIEIIPGRLYQGDAASVPEVAEAGIDTIVNVSEALDPVAAAPLGVPMYIRWPIPDADEIPQQETLRSLSNFIARLIMVGRKVYVHCCLPGTMVGAYEPIAIEEAPNWVVAQDGRAYASATVSRMYNGSIVRIVQRGQIPLFLTPEHPVLALRPYRNRGGRDYKSNWKPHFEALERYWQDEEPQWFHADAIRAGDWPCL